MEDVTSVNIKGKIEASPGPVLLEFWAPWASPCRTASPVIAEAEKKYTDLTVLRVNVDTEKDLAIQYNVKVVPTYVFVNVPVEGEVPKESSRMLGAKSRKAMLANIRTAALTAVVLTEKVQMK